MSFFLILSLSLSPFLSFSLLASFQFSNLANSYRCALVRVPPMWSSKDDILVALPDVRSLVSSKCPSVRQAAAATLGLLGEKGADVLSELIDLLSDSDVDCVVEDLSAII